MQHGELISLNIGMPTIMRYNDNRYFQSTRLWPFRAGLGAFYRG
ncbi:hypothetical protein SAMN05518847_101361 [Paenibacillus sp. OV219]|nr:hypothetical protein SAMN05518847_101361 [Paenibacillus sp. OV219]